MGVACSTCSDCFGRRPRVALYENSLQDTERDAVADLLRYLEYRSEINFFEGEPLRALSVLAYSDNVELQRSAALTFAEITEKEVRLVRRDTLEPIMILLQSRDVEVQRAASAALGNLAVNTGNKLLIVKMGGLEPLIRQMSSPNVEVQCNAVGCITNLATHDENKAKIAKSDALGLLVEMARSKDLRVQRNATGALLNMTHSHENRQQLVNAKAIPVLIGLLNSHDPDVQYYCTTALSNIAVDLNNRKKLAQTDNKLVQYLIALMDTKSAKVQCQAALALRNLASDEKYQLEIVRLKGLPPLLHLLQSSLPPLILSSVACIRNISIHPLNELTIIEAGFLHPLVDLLAYNDNEEIQCHAISTLRNLAASSERNKHEIVEAGAVEKIKALLPEVSVQVQSEMTAAIAVLALSEELKPRLLAMHVLDVLVELTVSQSVDVQGNSAAAIGNLSSKVKDYAPFVKAWDQPMGGLHDYLTRFLDDSQEVAFQHIAVWTIVQFLDGGDTELFKRIKKAKTVLDAVQRLANAADQMKAVDNNGEDVERDMYALARRVVSNVGSTNVRKR